MKQRSSQHGFTLMEILIVIGILGILFQTVLAMAGGLRDKANAAKAQAHVKDIHQAIIQLEIDTGEWPNHHEIGVMTAGEGNEIWDLNIPAAGITAEDGAFLSWDGPYLVSVQTDPWGNDYFYDSDYNIGTCDTPVWAVVIGSLGPNGTGAGPTACDYDEDNVIKVLYRE